MGKKEIVGRSLLCRTCPMTSMKSSLVHVWHRVDVWSVCMLVRQHDQYICKESDPTPPPSPRKKTQRWSWMPVFTMPLLWQTDKELAIGMLTAMIQGHEVLRLLWIHTSIIVHIRRCHHPQRQSYHTYLWPVYRAATIYSYVQAGNQNCRYIYGNHNQLVLQEVIDSLTVIHTRVIAIIIVLGVFAILIFVRLIGRTSPSNHIINKTWERNGLFLKSGILVLRHSCVHFNYGNLVMQIIYTM